MFQFVGLATLNQVDWPSASRVSPFGHPRIKGRSRLPAAFRSLPRPSSPPGAKASPVRPLVLVAYRACPAAFVHGRDLMSILALVFISPSELSLCHHCRSHGACGDIDCLLFVSFLILSKNPLSVPLAPFQGLGTFVESKGVEPLTPSLQSWCSSQLS